MDWLAEVHEKARRNNQVLFAKDSEYLADLADLVRHQNRRTLALWAFDLAEESVARLEETCPEEPRPREALEAARAWAAGDVKMPLARRKILDCHALAKELQDPEAVALCHAVGQACSVVHTAGHTLGYPLYDLTATVRRCGLDACADAVEERKQHYMDRLLYWGARADGYPGPWARFMLDPRS